MIRISQMYEQIKQKFFGFKSVLIIFLNRMAMREF
jgi:hypothetical protein